MFNINFSRKKPDSYAIQLGQGHNVAEMNGFIEPERDNFSKWPSALRLRMSLKWAFFQFNICPE